MIRVLPLIAACAAFVSRGEVIELTPAADTSIHQISTNNNMGGEQFFAIGTTGKGTAARALLKFDLAGKIPSGSAITNVSIRFVLPALNRPDATSINYQFHRLLRDWGEGVKVGLLGSPATSGDATWISWAHPNVWGIPGGQPGVDFVETPSGSGPMGPAPGTFTIVSSPGLVQDVDFWRNNAQQNFGWIARGVNESITTSAKRFSSSESTNAPLLRVEFSLVQELRIISVVKGDGTIELQWSGGTPPYQVESVDDIISVNWQPITTAINGTTAVFTTTEPKRFYRVSTVQ